MIDCNVICRCNLFIFADSQLEETDASHQIAGTKRPLSALIDLDLQCETGTNALPRSPRRWNRKPAVRVEKTPSFNTPLETPLPSAMHCHHQQSGRHSSRVHAVLR